MDMKVCTFKREALGDVNAAFKTDAQRPPPSVAASSCSSPETVGNNPEEFGAFFRNEMGRHGKRIRSLGLKAE
jgi:hypothetical protein